MRLFFVLENTTPPLAQILMLQSNSLSMHLFLSFILIILQEVDSLAILFLAFPSRSFQEKREVLSLPPTQALYEQTDRQTDKVSLLELIWSPKMLRTKPETMLPVAAHKSPKRWEDFC